MAPSRPSQGHCLIARLYMENKQPLWKEKRLQTVVLKTENHGGVHWTCCHADCFTALEDRDMQELGSASQQGLGRWWHPVISCFISGEEDWWIDIFFLKEFGLFHKQRKMMEEGSHTSLLPVQCFFLSRLKKFTRELRDLAFLTDYPIEIYTTQQNAFSRQITQICSMSLFHNLSAHREVWTGTAFCSVISFYFKSDLQFPDRKSEQKSCKIYYCDHITFLCGLLSI